MSFVFDGGQSRLRGHRRGVKCALCGADVHRFVPTRDRMHQIDGQFTVMLCGVCHLGFMHPQPDDVTLARHYPDTYYTFSDVETTPDGGRRLCTGLQRWMVQLPIRVASRLIYWQTSRQQDRAFDDVRGTGKCLDIGCGQGILLDRLRAQGWETFGVDVSPQACDVARHKGHHIHCGEVGDLIYPDESFELVTLVDSIEHVRDPLATLLAARRLLTKSGQIIIATPNVESWLARLFRRWYWQLDSPRHLYLFGPHALSLLSRHAALIVDLTYTRSNARGVAFSLAYFLTDFLGWPRDRFLLSRDGKRVEGIVDSSIIGALLGIPCLVGDLLCCGDEVYVHLSRATTDV